MTGIDTIERRPRRPPQAAFVPLLASRHPRDGSHPRPLCGCRDSGPVATTNLTELERLIEVPDPDLSCRADRRHAAATGICQRVVRSHQGVSRRGSRRMKAPVKSPAALLAPGRALTFANVAEGAEGLVVSDLARAVAAEPRPPAVSFSGRVPRRSRACSSWRGRWNSSPRFAGDAVSGLGLPAL